MVSPTLIFVHRCLREVVRNIAEPGYGAGDINQGGKDDDIE